MRKITEQAANAFNNNNRAFKSSNTEVKIIALESGKPCVIHLLLHGNVIAEKHTNKRTHKLYISACGWLSNTTKERLNALDGVSISQKNFIWYLNGEEWNGKTIKIN